MGALLLTTTSQITCTHGAPAVLLTSNAAGFALAAPVLLETDQHAVVGCPFTIGPKYSPCVRISWSAGATRVNVLSTPALTRSSVGKCFNAEGAVQGLALIAATQVKSSAL